jgi:L-alanine-DL-glutamate epimerase-like enolase superfamily enzyme
MKTDLRVDSLDVSVYTLPTDVPEADGTATWDRTTVVVVEPAAGQARGIGWSYTGHVAGSVIEHVLAGDVVGRSALDVPGVTAAMVRSVRNLGRPGLVATAISAVDVALWDLKAKLLELPLCRVLGRVADQVPVYGSGGFTTYDDRRTSEQLSHRVHELGISRVKIKIGESWGTCEQRDLHRIGLARQVVGEEAELYVDANGAYTRGQAVRVAHRFADQDVTWFESRSAPTT